MKEQMEVKEEDVMVKISKCTKCKKAVRFAIEHKMTTKSKNEFLKEVMKFNLSVDSISLKEFKYGDKSMCEC